MEISNDMKSINVDSNGKIIPRIVIIDSGVDKNNEKFKKYCPRGFSYYHGKVIMELDDDIGHGTAIYNIICKEAQNVEIINIRLKDIQRGINEEDLIGVLEYIKDYVECDIINISMGVSVVFDNERLEQICKKISKRGTIIVAAFDNSGAYSYPAIYNEVIGVTTGLNCKKSSDFEFVDDCKVNIAAKGNIQKLMWKNKTTIISAGNSFACAYVTAQVAKYMKKGIMHHKDILAAFKKDSIYVHHTDTYEKEKEVEFIIDKALIFPFNKEMHSIIRFEDMLPFSIVGVYDSKYLGKVGSTTSHVLKDKKVREHKILDIENISWKDADTLILGHVDELCNIIGNNELKKNVIQQALENGMNVYSFDDLSELDLKKSKKVYWPEINRTYVQPNPFGKLYRIGKPVLGIWGTSSKQGKFTLQLQMRKSLIARNIGVGQIGTEPSSILFKMDYVFPMGYNNTVNLDGIDSVRYLNGLMNRLSQKKENDIILVGSQSGTIPYDYGNIGLLNISQYNFLLGTLPDCVLLCVNPYDEIEFVKRTISFIESVGECKVLAIVVFPMDLKNEKLGVYGGVSVMEQKKYQEIKSSYSIPVFILGDEEHIEKMTDLVINFFSP